MRHDGGRGRLLGFSLGFLFALTPMALYFSGIVNPSGPEIAAGIAAWIHGVALTARAVRATTRASCGGSASPRASSARRDRCHRSGSCSTLGVLVIVAGSAAGQGARSAPRWSRDGPRAVVVVALIQVVWSAWAKPLSEGNTAQKGLDAPLSFIFRQSVGKLYWSNTREMIGVFGWLDTLVPERHGGDLAPRGRRARPLRGERGIAPARWALALTIALAFVVPVVIETARASANNLVWHGRYTLPFAVGIPILGGYALREVEGTRFAMSRVAWWLGVGFVVAQSLAFVEALRRYTVGVNGPVFFFWNTHRVVAAVAVVVAGLRVPRADGRARRLGGHVRAPGTRRAIGAAPAPMAAAAGRRRPDRPPDGSGRVAAPSTRIPTELSQTGGRVVDEVGSWCARGTAPP